MPFLLAIPYAVTQAKAAIFGAWSDPIIRWLIVAALAFLGFLTLKTYLQWGLISEADIKAVTRAVEQEASAEGQVIVRNRDASIAADALFINAARRRMEEVRNASQTGSDPIVISAGDDWLRGKARAGGR